MSLFESLKLDTEGLACCDDVTSIFERALAELEPYIVKAPREAALVRTKLQEVNFWAKRAVALAERSRMDGK